MNYDLRRRTEIKLFEGMPIEINEIFERWEPWINCRDDELTIN
jgi:hypothetical protein